MRSPIQEVVLAIPYQATHRLHHIICMSFLWTGVYRKDDESAEQWLSGRLVEDQYCGPRKFLGLSRLLRQGSLHQALKGTVHPQQVGPDTQNATASSKWGMAVEECNGFLNLQV